MLFLSTSPCQKNRSLLPWGLAPPWLTRCRDPQEISVLYSQLNFTDICHALPKLPICSQWEGCSQRHKLVHPSDKQKGKGSAISSVPPSLRLGIFENLGPGSLIICWTKVLASGVTDTSLPHTFWLCRHPDLLQCLTKKDAQSSLYCIFILAPGFGLLNCLLPQGPLTYNSCCHSNQAASLLF